MFSFNSFVTRSFFAIGLCFTLLPLQAQINERVDNFTLTNLYDGQAFSLDQYENVACVVVIFTTAYCPFSRSYQDRIKLLANNYTEANAQVKFILINPENPQDQLEAMKENAQQYGGIPYLFDPAGKIAEQFEATKAPEAFVLQYSVGHFVIKYHGAIDDHPQAAEKVEKFFLKDAIDHVLDKRNPDVPFRKPTGCILKNE